MRTFMLVCAILSSFYSFTSAQTLELDSNLQMQDQNIVYVPQQQGKIDPFDRNVHIALHYGVASRDMYSDEATQDFSVLGLAAYGYGRHWGAGMALYYFMEEESSESNLLVASDRLKTTASMVALDLALGVRFPIYFLDIFANTGLTFAKVSAEKTYTVSGNSWKLESVNETAAGAFAELGGRLYITSNINANILARYSSLEVETGDFPDERTIDMSGASIHIGVGYAFY